MIVIILAIAGAALCLLGLLALANGTVLFAIPSVLAGWILLMGAIAAWAEEGT